MKRPVLRTATHAAMALPLCAVLARPVPAEPQIVDEARLGLLAHDLVGNDRAESGADLNGEVLFRRTGLLTGDGRPAWLNALLDPHPLLGFSANLSGYTSQLYFGAAWLPMLARRIISPNDRIYSELSLGGAIHTGETGASNPKREPLGSRVLFHLAAEIGYSPDGRYSIGAYYEHVSNGGLARYNRSLNDAGVRLGYRF